MTCYAFVHFRAPLVLLLCIDYMFCAVQTSFKEQTYDFLVNPRIYKVHPDRKVVEINGWSLELDAKDHTIASETLKSEWIGKDGAAELRNVELCRYGQGAVQGVWKKSWAAITECDGNINGYVNVDDEVFTIEPLIGNSTRNVHTITKGM